MKQQSTNTRPSTEAPNGPQAMNVPRIATGAKWVLGEKHEKFRLWIKTVMRWRTMHKQFPSLYSAAPPVDWDAIFLIDSRSDAAIRGYFQTLGILADRIMEYDLDCDSQKLMEKNNALLMELASACPHGRKGRLIKENELARFEQNYLKFKLQMDYFIAVREYAGVPQRTGDDAEVHERTDDGAEVHEGTDDDWILISDDDDAMASSQPKSRRLTR